MSSRLSVCLLTRDEQRNIGRALRSVAGLADEVIVVDAGSTDQTGEIARSLGATLVPFAWSDDFSEGRNLAIRRASGAWVLWLNPDEELLPASRDEVRRLIEAEGDAFGYLALVQSVPREARPEQYSVTRDLRLFRNRPDLRYAGRLHPGFGPELAAAVAGEGLRALPSGVAIRHHAYMSTLDESKLRWAARLLERELADRPGQLHYLAEYGRNLLLLGEPRGHAVMAEALDKLAPTLDGPAPPGPDAPILLEYALTAPAGENRGPITADRARDAALRWFPDSPPLLWAMAESTFRARQFAAAAILLERLLHLGASGTYDASRPFEPRIVGPWALLNLGHCRRGLGDAEGARRCYGALLGDGDFAEQAARALRDLDAPPS